MELQKVETSLGNLKIEYENEKKLIVYYWTKKKDTGKLANIVMLKFSDAVDPPRIAITLDVNKYKELQQTHIFSTYLNVQHFPSLIHPITNKAPSADYTVHISHFLF